MSSISGPRGGQGQFSKILERQAAEKEGATNKLANVVKGHLKDAGVEAVAANLKPEAAVVLKGYAKILAFLDAPFAAIIEQLLQWAGIGPNVFTAAQLLFESDSIGLDPHEKLGIQVWQYKLLEDIHDKIKELQDLKSASFSQQVERKNQIEEEIRELLTKLKQGS